MGTTTLQLAEETVSGLQHIANESGQDVTSLAELAIFHYLQQEADRKIDREEVYYKSQHPQLLQLYADHYIAMHEGQVIDTDRNELELFLRIRQQYPTTGILIKKVTSEPDILWHMRSPRLEYD
jgi:hypothetical protein